MPKTTEELRDEIMEEYSFEEGDERIDKILEVKKDRYTATQQKREAQRVADELKKGKDHYKNLADPKGKKSQIGDGGEEPTLSAKDSARLMEKKIPVDDWDDVIDYAKYKGIPIADALKSSVVKATLAGKSEERKTAEATNTGGGKRGSDKNSGDKLLKQAEEKNEFPESDKDMEALAKARIDSMRPQA